MQATAKEEKLAEEKRRSAAGTDDIFSMVEQAAAGRISRPEARPVEPEERQRSQEAGREEVKQGR